MPKLQEVSERDLLDHIDAYQPPCEPHSIWLTYYLIFLLMEVAFTSLSWYCYVHPRIPPWFNLTIDNTTVRSGFTAVFSVWQSIAVGLALHICSVVFKKEKAACGELETTSWFSVITKPISDFHHSGKTFKVAIMTYLVLVVLRIVGNLAITISDGVGSEQSLPIGLISTFSLTTNSTDITSQAFLERCLQSNMIVRLKQLYKSPRGFVPPSNVLMPLPTQDLSSTSQVLYESDVLSFHHDCHWRVPDHYSGDTITIGNNTWTAKVGSNATTISGSRIVEYGSSIIFLLPKDQNFSGDSVYLFLGANATISPTFNSTSNNSWIDLSDLPTIFNHDGFTSRFTSLISLQALLATLLVCSPNLRFSSQRILLHPTTNHTEPDIIIQPNVGVASPGNIHLPAACILFSAILNATIMSEDPVNLTITRGSMNTNWVSSAMFLDGIQDEDRTSYPPFDRKTINDNVDKYTLSALKAFTSGYQGPVFFFFF